MANEPDVQTCELIGVSGRKVRMAHGTWSQTIPVEKLPEQRKFYQGLADRKDRTYARFYDPWIAVIDICIAEAKGRGLL